MAKAAAIYLIEDDESIRELVLYALESAGYAVRGFADGVSSGRRLRRVKRRDLFFWTSCFRARMGLQFCGGSRLRRVCPTHRSSC